MRITILTMGTRGDMQPYVALGAGLQRAGHQVTVAAPGVFSPFVEAEKLQFVPLAGDPARLIQDLIERAGNTLRTIPTVLNFALPIGKEVVDGVRIAALSADVILSSFLMVCAGQLAATERGIPHISAQIFPFFTPTGVFPAVPFPRLPLGGVYNRFTHGFATRLYLWGSLFGYRMLRQRLPGAPRHLPLPFRPSPGYPPTLYGFSPMVIPKPPDWGEFIEVTGYWHLDPPADWTPPPELVSFLEAGPPPIYVGFGSMITSEIERLTPLVIEAIRRTGQRGILLGGWGNLGSSEDQTAPDPAQPSAILRVESVPHGWLFPRMAAIVHHGGAGTTGAALRAGVPGVVVPFTADQPFWGQRVHALGLGPKPISYKHLTVDNLSAAITQTLEDKAMRARARQFGEALAKEDGINNAVQAIEKWGRRAVV